MPPGLNSTSAPTTASGSTPATSTPSATTSQTGQDAFSNMMASMVNIFFVFILKLLTIFI